MDIAQALALLEKVQGKADELENKVVTIAREIDMHTRQDMAALARAENTPPEELLVAMNVLCLPKIMKTTRTPRMCLDQEITRVMCELDELIFSEETKASQSENVTEIRKRRKQMTVRLHQIASRLEKVQHGFLPVKTKIESPCQVSRLVAQADSVITGEMDIAQALALLEKVQGKADELENKVVTIASEIDMHTRQDMAVLALAENAPPEELLVAMNVICSPKIMKTTRTPRMGLNQEITRVMCELDELIFNEETKASQSENVTEIRKRRKEMTVRLHQIASRLEKVQHGFLPVKKKIDLLLLSVEKFAVSRLVAQADSVIAGEMDIAQALALLEKVQGKADELENKVVTIASEIDMHTRQDMAVLARAENTPPEELLVAMNVLCSPKIMKTTRTPRMGLDQEITRVMCELDELIFSEETKASQSENVTEIRKRRKEMTVRLHQIASRLEKVQHGFLPVKKKIDLLLLNVEKSPVINGDKPKRLASVNHVVPTLSAPITPASVSPEPNFPVSSISPPPQTSKPRQYQAARSPHQPSQPHAPSSSWTAFGNASQPAESPAAQSSHASTKSSTASVPSTTWDAFTGSSNTSTQQLEQSSSTPQTKMAEWPPTTSQLTADLKALHVSGVPTTVQPPKLKAEVDYSAFAEISTPSIISPPPGQFQTQRSEPPLSSKPVASNDPGLADLRTSPAASRPPQIQPSVAAPPSFESTLQTPQQVQTIQRQGTTHAQSQSQTQAGSESEFHQRVPNSSQYTPEQTAAYPQLQQQLLQHMSPEKRALYKQQQEWLKSNPKMAQAYYEQQIRVKQQQQQEAARNQHQLLQFINFQQSDPQGCEKYLQDWETKDPAAVAQFKQYYQAYAMQMLQHQQAQPLQR
eukprot:CFRG5178T1